jgi:hypothetical protein
MRRFGFLALVLSTLALGCSDEEPTQPPPPSPGAPSITITPSTATVLVRASQPLVATPASSADSAVTWRILRDPALPDTANVGTIISTGPRSATYTAPPSVVPLGSDYVVSVRAVSTRDTTSYGVAKITVPRVKVTVLPNHVPSVPPATPVPFQVAVQYAPTPGFTLFVNGIANGDAGVGTLVQTGPAGAEYTSPMHDSSNTYALQAKSVEDPRHFGTAQVNVRPGFPVPSSNQSSDQFAPEWDPTSHRLAYVRGGSWDLVVYDFTLHTERVLARIGWSSLTYDGRIAWSDDGDRLVFSEQTAGRRTLGVVHADGTGRATFAPEAFTDYDEACFMPSSPESIYVAEHRGVDWSLRAYRLPALPGDRGRTLYEAAPTVEVHSPDAVILPPNIRPSVGFEVVVQGDGTVRSMKDDGVGLVGVAYSSATDRTPQVRWAIAADGTVWLTFVNELTHNVYRVDRSGLDLPQRCYSDYLAESASDLKANRPAFFAFPDAQAVSRHEPSGQWRIWVIGFPPSNIVPVPPVPGPQASRAGLARALLGR